MSLNSRVRNEIYTQARNGNLIRWTLNLIRRTRLEELTRIPLNEMNANHRSLIGDLAREQLIREQ